MYSMSRILNSGSTGGKPANAGDAALSDRPGGNSGAGTGGTAAILMDFRAPSAGAPLASAHDARSSRPSSSASASSSASSSPSSFTPPSGHPSVFSGGASAAPPGGTSAERIRLDLMPPSRHPFPPSAFPGGASVAGARGAGGAGVRGGRHTASLDLERMRGLGFGGDGAEGGAGGGAHAGEKPWGRSMSMVPSLGRADEIVAVGSIWRVLDMLVAAADLQFHAATSACVDFLESVPWSEEEQLGVVRLLSFLQLPDARPVLDRLPVKNLLEEEAVTAAVRVLLQRGLSCNEAVSAEDAAAAAAAAAEAAAALAAFCSSPRSFSSGSISTHGFNYDVPPVSPLSMAHHLPSTTLAAATAAAAGNAGSAGHSFSFSPPLPKPRGGLPPASASHPHSHVPPHSSHSHSSHSPFPSSSSSSSTAQASSIPSICPGGGMRECRDAVTALLRNNTALMLSRRSKRALLKQAFVDLLQAVWSQQQAKKAARRAAAPLRRTRSLNPESVNPAKARGGQELPNSVSLHADHLFPDLNRSSGGSGSGRGSDSGSGSRSGSGRGGGVPGGTERGGRVGGAEGEGRGSEGKGKARGREAESGSVGNPGRRGLTRTRSLFPPRSQSSLGGAAGGGGAEGGGEKGGGGERGGQIGGEGGRGGEGLGGLAGRETGGVGGGKGKGGGGGGEVGMAAEKEAGLPGDGEEERDWLSMLVPPPPSSPSLPDSVYGKDGSLTWLVGLMLEHGLADEVFKWLATDHDFVGEVLNWCRQQQQWREARAEARRAVRRLEAKRRREKEGRGAKGGGNGDRVVGGQEGEKEGKGEEVGKAERTVAAMGAVRGKDGVSNAGRAERGYEGHESDLNEGRKPKAVAGLITSSSSSAAAATVAADAELHIVQVAVLGTMGALVAKRLVVNPDLRASFARLWLRVMALACHTVPNPNAVKPPRSTHAPWCPRSSSSPSSSSFSSSSVSFPAAASSSSVSFAPLTPPLSVAASSSPSGHMPVALSLSGLASSPGMDSISDWNFLSRTATAAAITRSGSSGGGVTISPLLGPATAGICLGESATAGAATGIAAAGIAAAGVAAAGVAAAGVAAAGVAAAAAGASPPAAGFHASQSLLEPSPSGGAAPGSFPTADPGFRMCGVEIDSEERAIMLFGFNELVLTMPAAEQQQLYGMWSRMRGGSRGGGGKGEGRGEGGDGGGTGGGKGEGRGAGVAVGGVYGRLDGGLAGSGSGDSGGDGWEGRCCKECGEVMGKEDDEEEEGTWFSLSGAYKKWLTRLGLPFSSKDYNTEF
ncbi:unnamed protein product [Closterium sp. NIES-54]